MQNKNTKYEFLALLTFLVAALLLLTNGFVGRISAQSDEPDVYQSIEPIGQVLQTILDEYVRDAKLDQVVEGALVGMMSSLDRHSSFIRSEDLKALKDDTRGEFEGIGVSIKLDDNDNVIVFAPIVDSPAAKAGIRPFDIIRKIDDINVVDLWTPGLTSNEKLSAAADKIRGPVGTAVKLTIERPHPDREAETIEVSVKRAKVALESIKEARLLANGIGYIRLADFKDNTAADLKKKIKEMSDQGMKSLVLDLRWNPGGLLTASQQVCDLFLSKNSMVTYTKGRAGKNGAANPQDMELRTQSKPAIPAELPMILLVNEQTASSSEIVTGALQFHQRAVVVGEKTFGKGSVQTIIPVPPRNETALRLTTALYYTPAGVTIDHQGILPDVQVPMPEDQQRLLGLQMYKSYESDPAKVNEQNHGSVTGNDLVRVTDDKKLEQDRLLHEIGLAYGEDAVKLMQEYSKRKRATDETVEDVQLKRAVEILSEDPVWENLLKRYHRDVRETQTAAKAEDVAKLSAAEQRLLEIQSKSEGPAAPEVSPDMPPVEDAPVPAEPAPAP